MPIILCAVSGMFGALLFNYNILGLLGWVALVPLFTALPHLQGRRLAWCTVLFGFLWYYLSCFWLHSLVVFHWLIPFGVVCGALYFGLYFLLFSFPAAWCCRSLPLSARPWAIAVCWTAVEYLRSFTDMAFPWDLLGHSQAPFNTLHMSLASIGGVYLISFLMALVNAALAVAIVEWRTNRHTIPAVAGAAVPLLFVIIVSAGLGHWQFSDSTTGSKLKVSVIQPGVSQLTKWNATIQHPDETTGEFEQRYRETDGAMQQSVGMLINEAARQDKPQLVVLPESLFLTNYFPYETRLHQDLATLSRQIDADLFFGADNLLDQRDYDKLAAKGQRFLQPGDQATTWPLATPPVHIADDGTTSPDFSGASMAATVAAWQVSRKHGLEPRVYSKMQLVPFGETVPFINGFDWLRKYLETSGIAGEFKPGFQNTLFETDGSKFGAVICFESTFSYLTRHLAQGGAQFICVLTNDAWYDPDYAIKAGGFWGTIFNLPGLHQLASGGPSQHLVQSQFRAIETGLPIVRSANNGISALIDKHGRVQKQLSYQQSGFLSGDVNLVQPIKQTFSVRFGEWVGLICLGLWTAIFVRMIARRWIR